jgi:hypothetical protein
MLYPVAWSSRFDTPIASRRRASLVSLLVVSIVIVPLFLWHVVDHHALVGAGGSAPDAPPVAELVLLGDEPPPSTTTTRSVGKSIFGQSFVNNVVSGLSGVARRRHLLWIVDVDRRRNCPSLALVGWAWSSRGRWIFFFDRYLVFGWYLVRRTGWVSVASVKQP